MKRFVTTLADAEYLIGAVGLLESIRVHHGDDPDREVYLWYQESAVAKQPGKNLGPNYRSSLLRSTVTDFEELRSIVEKAYPFVHMHSTKEIANVQLPEHAFYMKAAIVRATVDLVGEPAAVLYLDADCLVNDQLTNVWSLIEHDFFLLAPDPNPGQLRHLRKQWERFLGESIRPHAYGCAAVLGFNSKHYHLIRRWEDVTVKIVHTLVEADFDPKVAEVFGNTDQDAINMVTALSCFGSRSQRMIVPRDLIDYQRNFYDAGEFRAVALPDPLRIERQRKNGTRVYRAALLHCWDKWWHRGCITPVRSVGFFYYQNSPMASCFEYNENGWPQGGRNQKDRPVRRETCKDESST